MARPYHIRRHSTATLRPLIGFLLIASFGILFAGCADSRPDEGAAEEEFTFTADDLARFRELARNAQEEVEQRTGTGTFVPRLGEEQQEQEITGGVPVLDLSNVKAFNELRQGPGATGGNLYKVTNEFVNVRSDPRVTAAAVGRLVKGDSLEVLDFADAAWAHVRLPSGGVEGYVSTRYIAKLVSEENLPQEKAAFDGMYFVNFGFLNVRKSPDTGSEKVGELPGQTILKPISMDDVWARVSFQGKEGYAAREYLEPFLPNFLVRQEQYSLPILHYRLAEGAFTGGLAEHINSLRAAGYTFITLRDFYSLVLSQEQRDVRLEPKRIILAFSDVTPEALQDVSSILLASRTPATFFISGKHLGLGGITEKQVLTLLANGFDLQSGAHSGDDLRAMTNAQVELELQQSRKLLEDMTKRPVVAVAYPWGGVNDRVMAKAADLGYLFGIGVAPKAQFTRAEFLQLPSLLVSGGMTGEDVLLLAQGA
ncbi:MAG: SH3 domain-containing protein [Candidatus Peribacteraceae bacterium]|nr:SH3 domain-containing protein [Candidatus Peribacteraceae bacterium]